MQPPQDDAELARRCAQGDRVAWERLVKRYSALVWTVIGRSGLRPERGEDIFQEVFAAAFAALPRMADPARIDAWLVTTARRMVWREWRKSRQSPGEVPEELAGADESVETLTAAQETRLVVWRGLDAISPRCRELLLAAFSGESPPNYDQLAIALGVPRGSLGPTRQRCLKQLAERLRELGFGDTR